MNAFVNVISIAVASGIFLSCQSAAVRQPASQGSKNTMGDRRMNPGQVNTELYTNIFLHDGRITKWKVGKLNLQKFDLSIPAEAEKFFQVLKDIQTQDEAEKNRTGKKGYLSKGAALCLNTALSLGQIIQDRNSTVQDSKDATIHLAEVIASFNYNFQYPFQDQIWILTVPFKILDNLDNPMMTEKAKPASNLNPVEISLPLSKRNPLPSTFWQIPKDIKDKNIFYAFNENENPHFEQPCTYDSPKDGYGTHGGFALICHGRKWKFKFGNESKTEPFNARIVWALGYNATPVDYAQAGIKVVFDPKIISEYNSRKDLSLKFNSVLGFTYKKVSLQPHLNPYKDAIMGALLKNGDFVKSEILEEQYPQLEKDIQYLVLREASAEAENIKEKNLGPWGWTDFDHRDRRELRAFGMIAAFLNLFDMRTENNRLRARQEEDGSTTLLHYVSDLGSGLGSAKNILHNKNGAFDKMPWSFILHQSPLRPANPLGKGHRDRQREYLMLGYNLLEENQTFRRIQIEDAQWATRLLAQLSEQQLQDGLIAAGLDAAEVKLVLEKLLKRRQGMLKAFGLDKEYPEIMRRAIDQKFSYDPRSQNAPTATGSREKKSAPVGDHFIIEGRLKKY